MSKPSKPREEHWDDVTTAVSVDQLAQDSHRAAHQPYLTVMAGSRVGEMIQIPHELTLGRGSDADFRITDVGVSRLHLTIRRLSDNRVLVEDLRSRNGTYVNNARTDKTILHDGDKIRLGSTAIIKFSYGDQLDASFQQRMYDAALRDALTQLYNRRYLFEQLEIEFTYAQRHGTPLSFVLLDLDHFKPINDTHGHSVGDQVLQVFARTLVGAIRREDVAGRYGGEEFAVVCRGVDGKVAMRIADRIRRSIESQQIIASIPALRVTVSAGVVAIPAPGIVNSKDLVDAADKALYDAKEQGRNRVHLYLPPSASGATKP